MTNAEKFKQVFELCATELWAMPEKDFLVWLNAEVPDKNVGDMISRQAAIDAIEKYFNGLPIAVHVDMLAMIHRLPSTQSERKKGKWIEPTAEGNWTFDKNAYAECSVCGKKEFLGWRKNFCPNCGSDMRGEQQ